MENITGLFTFGKFFCIMHFSTCILYKHVKPKCPKFGQAEQKEMSTMFSHVLIK